MGGEQVNLSGQSSRSSADKAQETAESLAALNQQIGSKVWLHPLFSIIWSSSRKDVVLGLLLSPIHAAAEIMLAFLSGALLQLIFSTGSEVTLQRILPSRIAESLRSFASLNRQELMTLIPALLILIGFVRMVTSFGSNYLLERAGHRVAHALRSEFLNSYLHSSGRILDARHPDEMTNRILLDTTLMQGLVSKGTIGALRDGMVVIGAALSMVWIASQFVFILLLLFVPFFLFLRRISRRLEFFTREAARRQVQLATRGLQMRQGLLAIHGMGAQRREKDDLSELSESYYGFMKGTLFLRTAFRPGTEFAAITILAAALHWRLNLSVDVDVASYSTMFVLAALSFRPLKNVSSFVSQFAELKAVWKRLMDEWDLTHQSQSDDLRTVLPHSNQLMRSGLALELRHVVYDAFNGRRILNDCSLAIPVRSRIALVGESGAGKSTVLRLMAGLLPETSGLVLGSENTVLATQTPYVFQGTILENIIYPLVPKKSGEMNRARDKAASLVLSLMLAHTQAGAELFLNKKIGFMGEGLSGGEKARVALARLLFADKPVLLLDEPTANLDPESSKAFWDAVWKWQKQAGDQRAVVAVTHHMNDLASFEQCHLFSNGSLIASGSSEEILAARMRLSEVETPNAGLGGPLFV